MPPHAVAMALSISTTAPKVQSIAGSQGVVSYARRKFNFTLVTVLDPARVGRGTEFEYDVAVGLTKLTFLKSKNSLDLEDSVLNGKNSSLTVDNGNLLIKSVKRGSLCSSILNEENVNNNKTDSNILVLIKTEISIQKIDNEIQFTAPSPILNPCLSHSVRQAAISAAEALVQEEAEPGYPPRQSTALLTRARGVYTALVGCRCSQVIQKLRQM